jgi:hypothetical protein
MRTSTRPCAWQDEVERALFTMDALFAVHTPGFSKSVWSQQEIGFALGRGVKVISFKMGENPTGFISKHRPDNMAQPRRSQRRLMACCAVTLSHKDGSIGAKDGVSASGRRNPLVTSSSWDRPLRVAEQRTL